MDLIVTKKELTESQEILLTWLNRLPITDDDRINIVKDIIANPDKYHKLDEEKLPAMVEEVDPDYGIETKEQFEQLRIEENEQKEHKEN